MRTRSSFATALLFALAAALEGQPSTKPFEVSPFVGYLFGGNILTSTPFAPIGVADHLDYGVRVGYVLENGLEPEIEWSRSETSLSGGFPLTIDYALAGVAYNISRDRVRPFVSLDLGAAKLAPPTSSETDFAASLGVGLKTFITPSFGLRIEARGYASKLHNTFLGRGGCWTVSEPSGQIVPVACPVKPWLLNGEISGGLLLAF